jgi:hypothetical protein
MNDRQELKIKLGVEIVVYVTILLILGAVASIGIQCCGGWNIEYSEGSRSGVVQKFSKKGVIWKTWEGELNLGYNDSRRDSEGRQTISPAIFYFSCSSDDAAKQIKLAEKNGRRVTVDYRQYILRGLNKGATSYDVEKVTDESRQ